MPELPEVTTTAKMLDKMVKGRKIISVWTNYDSPYYYGKENIKDPKYFKKFSREISGKKILRVWRRAKNVLIDISLDKTILIHMKMTGHLLYGRYKFTQKNWQSIDENLKDPFSRFIRLIFKLDNGKYIAFSDMRKFATVKLISDKKSLQKEFAPLGPEPLDKNFDFEKLKQVLSRKKNGKIKTVLMDPTVVVGIGNIYSDEALWLAGIHPEKMAGKLKDDQIKKLLKSIKVVLKNGIDFGGDSMSDYRQPDGKRGDFQNKHRAYRRTGEKCSQKNCPGKIIRKIVNGRSTHFCDTHQKK
jgi:formamidopyrimidine-DNA glycosylase